MLESLRNATNNIFIKILFGLIILSFCLFGISDIIRNYSASKSVVCVGDTKIIAEMFLRLYDQERQYLRNNDEKHPLSDEEIAKIDIKEIVLKRIIENSVLTETIKNFHINIPKKSIISVIYSLPEFRRNGVFDQKLYEQVLKSNEINEVTLIHKIQENLATIQLLHPIVVGYRVPNMIKEIIAKEYETQNTILIKKIHVGISDKFDPKYTQSNAKILEYYNANLDKYKKPETRKFAILVIDYRKLLPESAISQKDIDERYMNDCWPYVSSTKDFQKLAFETKEDADKAWNMINKNMNINDICKKFAIKIEDIKDCKCMFLPVPDYKIREKLFELKEGVASDIYDIDGKYCIYINTKTTLLEQEAAAHEPQHKYDIKEELKIEKIRQPEFYGKIKELRNKIDDGFAAGKSIESIAAETDMEIVEVPNVEKNNIDQKLSSIIEDDKTSKILADSIWDLEANQASEIVDSSDKPISYVAFVREISKAGSPDVLDKEKIQIDIANEEMDQQAQHQINEIINLEEKSAEIVAKMDNVEKFILSKKEFMLENSKAKIEKISQLGLNVNMLFKFLSTMNMGQTVCFKLLTGDYILFSIQKKQVPEFANKMFIEELDKSLNYNTISDMNNLFIFAFKSQLKIKINDKAIDNMVKKIDISEKN